MRVALSVFTVLAIGAFMVAAVRFVWKLVAVRLARAPALTPEQQAQADADKAKRKAEKKAAKQAKNAD